MSAINGSAANPPGSLLPGRPAELAVALRRVSNAQWRGE